MRYLCLFALLLPLSGYSEMIKWEVTKGKKTIFFGFENQRGDWFSKPKTTIKIDDFVCTLKLLKTDKELINGYKASGLIFSCGFQDKKSKKVYKVSTLASCVFKADSRLLINDKTKLYFASVEKGKDKISEFSANCEVLTDKEFIEIMNEINKSIPKPSNGSGTTRNSS